MSGNYDDGRTRCSLRPGCIIPHVYLRKTQTKSTISSLDLCNLGTTFTFIASDLKLIRAMVAELKKNPLHKENKTLMTKFILIVPTSQQNNTFDVEALDIASVFIDISGDWKALCDEWDVSGVLVRPDQHIQLVLSNESDLVSKIAQLSF
mmetsp:Transcript_3364/g.4243  ORF Transcript_3364/g.4243 Transcript_3364/m.4243 type:complete len:150 (-) Transcript_3364:77-526(-)